MDSFVVKIKSGEVLRRLVFSERKETIGSSGGLTFADVEKRARDVFQIENFAEQELVFTYTDKEGDVVTLASDEELRDALVEQGLNPLRLNLVVQLKVSQQQQKVSTFDAANARVLNLMKDWEQHDCFLSRDGALQLWPMSRRMNSDGGCSDATSLSESLSKISEKMKTQNAGLSKFLKLYDVEKENRSAAHIPAIGEKSSVAGVSFDDVKMVHNRVTCDDCGMTPIVGSRFRSKVVHDYDLCLVCFKKIGEADGSKADYERIDKPVLVPLPSDSWLEKGHCYRRHDHHHQKPLHGHLGRPMRGFFPPFAPRSFPPVPIGCRSGWTARERSFGNNFIPSRCGYTVTEEKVIHNGVTCDGCNEMPLTGPRFKSCKKDNYDLCERCFAHQGCRITDYRRIDRPDLVPFMQPLRRYLGSWSRPGRLFSRFVQDVTIFDGTQLLPGSPFTKIWRLHNSGLLPWPAKTKIIHIGGDDLSCDSSSFLEIGAQGLAPGLELDVSLNMVAPEKPGRYVSHFRLQSPDGHRFGHRIWVLVEVVAQGDTAQLPKVMESSAVAGDSEPLQNEHEQEPSTVKEQYSLDSEYGNQVFPEAVNVLSADPVLKEQQHQTDVNVNKVEANEGSRLGSEKLAELSSAGFYTAMKGKDFGAHGYLFSSEDLIKIAYPEINAHEQVESSALKGKDFGSNEYLFSSEDLIKIAYPEINAHEQGESEGQNPSEAVSSVPSSTEDMSEVSYPEIDVQAVAELEDRMTKGYLEVAPQVSNQVNEFDMLVPEDLSASLSLGASAIEVASNESTLSQTGGLISTQISEDWNMEDFVAPTGEQPRLESESLAVEEAIPLPAEEKGPDPESVAVEEGIPVPAEEKGPDPESETVEEVISLPAEEGRNNSEKQTARQVDMTGEADVDIENMEDSLLAKLNTMGFTDRALNLEVLQKHNFDLRATVDDLCTADEWDPILEELEEMGFYDTQVNRRLMFKNNGSVKLVVKELVQMSKETKKKSKNPKA